MAGLGAHAGEPLAPLETRVQWIALAHEIVAVDAVSRGERRAPLGVGERVLGSWADGEIGVAQTNRRLLGVTTRAGGIHEARFRVGEQLTLVPQLGDRVAIAHSPQRAFGFDGGSGNWVEASLGPRERVLAAAVANRVAALVTDRRALALSPIRGGFFEVALALQDAPLELSATGDLATLRTRTRLLVYGAGQSRWSERALGLGN
jgi:hypothetical protein